MRSSSVSRLLCALLALSLVAALSPLNSGLRASERMIGIDFFQDLDLDAVENGDVQIVRGADGEDYYVFAPDLQEEEEEEEEESPTPRRSSGFLAACLGDDYVYRGQNANAVIPPAESTSTTSTIGTTTVSSATSDVVAPPVVGSDKPFDPQPITPSNGEPTTFQKIFKYRQELSGYYMFIPRNNKNGLGFHELNARLLFAIPCKTMQSVNNMNNGYFLLTPNFTYDHLKISKDKGGGSGNFFDAGLTTTFLANYNDVEAHVDFSIGVSSSFKKVTCKSIYYRGRAEVGLPIDNQKQVKLFGGVEYLDAIRYKLVPIVGIKYDPNPQNQLRIAFPNPRWDHYLTKVNETDWWLFVHGDITSQRWLVHSNQITVKGKHDFNIDYTDYKIGVGVSFDCPTRLRGSFEVGGAFGREMRAAFGTFYKPKNAVYLKAGLLY